MDSKEFALQVTQQLQSAGYEALWAGGCVRDQMLGIVPKDYDVATNALPEQVRELFGRKRTLAIGASFGVITVLGPKTALPIEVATFRRDAGYSDGRRPDAVEYTDAKEDALRRDFTINGMFFDPVSKQVLDYVGGVDDLNAKVIRAIGAPEERIEEDKLRMLRAVRFAATYDCVIEPRTLSAVQDRAHQIGVVSGERIGAEMRRILAHPNRAIGVRLLRESHLLLQILPEAESLYADESKWSLALRALGSLTVRNFSVANAILLAGLPDENKFEKVFEAWKLSNEEKKTMAWVTKNCDAICEAHTRSWSEIQPLLIHQEAEAGVEFAMAMAMASESAECLKGVQFCRERMAWDSERLNPEPLLDGNRLKQLDIKVGPQFGTILKRIRAEQLDGELTTFEQAAARARELAN